MAGIHGSGAGQPAGMDGQPLTWLDMSPADFDRRRVAKGFKGAGSAGQPGLFTVATPTAPRKSAPAREELPGQLDMPGDERS